jgi:hypothetical protein
MVTGLAHAQSNIEGYVYGTGKAGTEVRLESTETNAVRTATVTGTGTFRTPTVSPGAYKITYTNPAGTVVSRTIVVSIGSGTSADITTLDAVVVSASSAKQVDMTATEIVSTLSSEEINQLPVMRDIQEVAQMAPGALMGDAGFTSQSNRPLISFGGASPGENSYFINGFNVTDFRNFLGGATIPFEFYDQFELRTGGYSAEFGRSLGGVINAVTKRGTNEWDFGVSAYWQPDVLTAKRPNVYVYDPAKEAYTLRTDNRKDYNSETELTAHVGGPIIADRLFFFAMATMRDYRDDDASGTTKFTQTTDATPFYGVKLDWQIADNHKLEYTYISDKTSTDVNNYDYYANIESIGGQVSIGTREEGGTSNIFHYSGTLFENFTLSALYGLGERSQKADNNNYLTGTPCTVLTDTRGGAANSLGCWDSSGNGQVSSTKDTRDVFRVDLTYQLGNHSLKLGYDLEKNVSDTKVQYEGGRAYRYSTSTAGTTINGGVIPGAPGTPVTVVRQRFYNVSGSFKENNTALYLEDSWQMTDRLMVTLGVRNETLENFNKAGEEFLGFDAQITPRVGFSFDMLGDGRTKLFGNLGRYTMPIATNTNIRFAGGEFFTEQYFGYGGMNGDQTPILGAPIGTLRTLSDGSIPVPQESVDKDIQPMYQDEAILGIQSNITDSTLLGAKVTYRTLVRAVEDSSFVDANDNFSYFLFNPGNDVTLRGPGGQYSTITAAQLTYPEAEREYWAVELTFDHKFTDKFRIGGSYTWSHSYGNFEGVFNSDVQQDDAGITISFDTPGMALYSNGDLPNDRRHNLKMFGNYAATKAFSFSFNAYAISGRPLNARGNCPTAIDPDAYDQDCFFVSGVPSPRASGGRLPWTYNLDLGMRYTPDWYDKLTFGFDVFNVLNFQHPTRLVETKQEAGDEGAPLSPAYGATTYFQEPLHARLSVRWQF